MTATDTQIPDEGRPGRWWAMLGVGLAVFMATLDVSIINVSLPTLIEELDTDFPTIQWVMVGYVLVLTSLLLTMGRLGDMVGKTRLYCCGLLLFTSGSLLCGLAPSVGWLIGFRLIQGMGAAVNQALGAAIAVEVFPARDRGRTMGIIGGTVSVGLAVGPALGGVLIGLFGWRSIFLVNVPVGILALFIILRSVPRLPPSEEGQRFDPAGAGLMLVALGCYALAMTLGQRIGFGDARILGLLVGAGAAVFLFLLVESRVDQPMLELSLFKNGFFSANLVMGWLVFIGLGGQFILPFYLELVKGYPTTTVGLLMMTIPAAMGVTSIAAGMLSDRFGPRGITVLGLLVVVGGCLSISTLDGRTTAWQFVLAAAPFGVGMGLFQSPNNSAIMGAAPRRRLGVASGLMALSRTLGHTTGIPLIGAIFTALVMARAGTTGVLDMTSAPREAISYAQSSTYLVAAGLMSVSAVMGIVVWLASHRKH